jgi:hypothetical protein
MPFMAIGEKALLGNLCRLKPVHEKVDPVKKYCSDGVDLDMIPRPLNLKKVDHAKSSF